jgi:TetR/AcrR family transcriptional regulator, transcriptional repressor for nem operon
MESRARRTRRNDPRGLRARVLDVAASLFQSHGYHATSMHDLLAATGVSGGALHHHFPTKKALALAVVTDRVAPAVRQTWIEPIRAAPSLGKGVAEVFAAIAAGIEERGSVAGCPLNNLALELAFSDAEFRDAIYSVFAEWQAALAERIGRTRGGLRLDPVKRTAAAAFIVAAYSGAMNLAKASQSAAPLRSCARALGQWLDERQFAR